MTGENEKPQCDVEDLMCQMGVLSHLKGMQSLLGDEKFKSAFPEFEGLGKSVSSKIQTQKDNLRESLERCGLPPIEESIVVTPASVTGSEESADE